MGVVFYNPTGEQCQKVTEYSSFGIFSKLIICDNSQTILEYKFPDNVEYYHMGFNSGLSIPYNRFITISIEKEADVLCIMDQDSLFKENDIKYIVNYIDEHYGELNEVAVVCPRLLKVNTVELEKEASCKAEYVKWTINSGSFLIMKNIQKNKLCYDNNIFLDGVDKDFCMNIKLKNLKILRVNKSILHQSFGYSYSGGGFDHHSASRYFNIAHNRKYIYRKYYGIKGFLLAILVNTRLAFRILFHEDKRVEKVIACLKGTFK